MTVTAAGARPAVPLVAELDVLSETDFVVRVTPLFEGASAYLHRLAALRPFGTPTAFFARARDLALELPEAEAIELVNAHPRLGASPASVSALSFVEQGYDRGEDSGGATGAELRRLNDAYEDRFGFRYCVFVAGRTREALLPGFRKALASGDRAAELRRALEDIVRIAEDRYRTLHGDGA